MSNFTFGTCTVPCGKSGPWHIEDFEVTEEEARLHNLRCMMNRDPFGRVEPGTYKRLVRGSTTVMSNTPMEIRTNREAYLSAQGRVLVNGLGLGMLLEGLLHKDKVTYIRVIEVDPELIQLVGWYYQQMAEDRGIDLDIVHADALEYKPEKGEVFDYVWHDIWDNICEDNREQMTLLARRYGQKTKAQGIWAKDLLDAYRR